MMFDVYVYLSVKKKKEEKKKTHPFDSLSWNVFWNQFFFKLIENNFLN